MSLPVTYSLYMLTTTFPGTNHVALSSSAPADANTTWGWNMGQLTPPRFCQMDQGVEVPRTSLQWTTTPSGSVPNNTIGDCMVAGPYSGIFNNGRWEITMSVRAVTQVQGQDGGFIYRLWKSSTPTGVGATLITSSYESSSVVTNLTTTVTPLYATVTYPTFIMRNEYILLQTWWSIIGASTNNTSDADFSVGATRGCIRTSYFNTYKKTNVNLIQDDLPI